MTADAALEADAGSGESHSATEEAEEFLREVLADGSVWAKDVKRQAGEAGIANRTLMRAKRDLGVKSYREEADEENKHKWFWIWPNSANPTQGCHVKNVGNLGTLDHSKDAKDAKTSNGHPCDQVGTLSEPDDNYSDLPACLDRRLR
jgi:hypothetical protein